MEKEKSRMEKFFDGTGPGNTEEEAWNDAMQRAGKLKGKVTAELHDAVRAGDKTRVIELLDAGADVNARDEYGKTPLHRAAWQGNDSAVELLLERGADVNARDNHGLTARGIIEIRYADMVRAVGGPEHIVPDEMFGEPYVAGEQNPLAWTERVDGAQLAEEAEAEKPRCQAEAEEWQRQYNTPRTPETPETEQTETEATEQGQDEDLTPRLRPGL